MALGPTIRTIAGVVGFIALFIAAGLSRQRLYREARRIEQEIMKPTSHSIMDRTSKSERASPLRPYTFENLGTPLKSTHGPTHEDQRDETDAALGLIDDRKLAEARHSISNRSETPAGRRLVPE